MTAARSTNGGRSGNHCGHRITPGGVKGMDRGTLRLPHVPQRDAEHRRRFLFVLMHERVTTEGCATEERAVGCSPLSPVNFRRDRAYFAAVETQVAQHAVIELAKRVAERACLAALSIAHVRSACECADCPHHLGNDLGEGERALDPCRTMQFVRARRSGRGGRTGLGIAAEAVHSTRMARPRFDVIRR